MRKRERAVISVFSSFLILAIAVNLPIIPHTVGCATEYESYMNYEFPCGLSNFCGGSNVRTITSASITLYSGYTATTNSNANSSFTFVLNNPGCSAHLTSLSLWNNNQTLKITNWDNSTFDSSASNFINFSSTSLTSNNFLPHETRSFTYYPVILVGPRELISNGQVYTYVISFNNGQSVSGYLTAK